MPLSPYAPPKSEVADVLPQQPVRWARATWLHLPVFVGLLLLVFDEWEAIASGFTSWGIWAGLILTAILAYFPMRSLHALSDKAPPQWSDVLYYATAGMFAAGLVSEDVNLIVAGAGPTVLLNGINGVMALIVEKRQRVRVYISGRRYVFSTDGTL